MKEAEVFYPIGIRSNIHQVIFLFCIFFISCSFNIWYVWPSANSRGERDRLLKIMSAIFFVFTVTNRKSLKIWKILLFISFKKLFTFSRYSNICIFSSPLSLSRQPLQQQMIKDKSKNLKWWHHASERKCKNTFCSISPEVI